MFDYDEIEETCPSAATQGVTSALRPGETQGPAGFAYRAPGDPLRELFPLRHLVRLDEWAPPESSCNKRRGQNKHPKRLTLCVGPPSSRALDWASPDEFGCRGTEESGNALVLLADRSRDELFLLECASLEGGLDAVSRRIASVLADTGHSVWAGVGVGVGTWVLMTLLKQEFFPDRCVNLHMVGFPPPHEGLGFPRPKGVADQDWDLAATCTGLEKTMVPLGLSVYPLLSDSGVTREQMLGWFKLQKSLQDGSTKGAYPIFAVQGDFSILQHAKRRTDLFWTLANASWGEGPVLVDGPVPTRKSEFLKSWWDAIAAHGQGPPRKNGFFDEGSDLLLCELNSDASMVPFTNYHGRAPAWFPSDNFCGGSTAIANGLDIRMYADRSTQNLENHIGSRTVCAVRFGNGAGISSFPGGANGVHGGAIQAVMDETTAICCRVWISPASTTRKISHQISKPAYMYQTYRVVCEVDSLKNEGAIIVIKGKLLDLLGEVICITTAEMLDFERMTELQHQ